MYQKVTETAEQLVKDLNSNETNDSVKSVLKKESELLDKFNKEAENQRILRMQKAAIHVVQKPAAKPAI